MKIENKRYLYYAEIFLFMAIVFGIYFCMFHGDLSDDSYIWSNFGNYINGFLTPLLTIINIIVFIELTIAISNIEEHRSVLCAFFCMRQLRLLRHFDCLNYLKNLMNFFRSYCCKMSEIGYMLVKYSLVMTLPITCPQA